MKSISLALALIITLMFSPGSSAQTLGIVAKGGYTDYGAIYIGSMGGSGNGDQDWARGPIFGLGARLRIAEWFAVEAMLNYSENRYEAWGWEPTPLNEPWNRILDFNVIARMSIGIYGPVYFAILGGLGLSYQDMDEVVALYSGLRHVTAGRQVVDVSGVLGYALEGRVSTDLELSLEGTWHVRRFTSPVLQLGISYMAWRKQD